MMMQNRYLDSIHVGNLKRQAIVAYCVAVVCEGKNDAYVTIKHGNELYQTSVCGRTTQPEWLEQCDL